MTTRVYVEPELGIGRGIMRVRNALARYAPEGVEIVTDRSLADLEVLHVIGLGSLAGMGERPYAMIQYCFATTEKGPDVDFWGALWRKSRAVWSYYDLPGNSFKRLHQPLGVDPEIFHERNNANGREYAIATHGYVAETEAVHECARAAARCELKSAHLGPNLKQGGDTYLNLSEEDTAALWSRSERVAALRRVEGFELPGFEGLLCGARPVAFDAPHYRQWFGTHADYVPESAPKSLTRNLAALFQTPVRPVSTQERRDVAELCSWPRLCENFWSAIL